jgi:hypothetical protein
LNAHWRRLPPASVQLARIAGALGIKPSVDDPSPDDKENQQNHQHLAMLIDSMPASPMPRTMTPEEYLQTKNAR